MAYATVDDLAAALRVTVTVQNTPTLQSCLDAAAAEINHTIDADLDEVSSADWIYSTTLTMADPGAGNVRFNKSNANAVQNIALSATTAGGVTVAPGDIDVDDHLRFYDATNSNRWEQFLVTNPVTVNAGWGQIPVTHENASGDL